MYLGNLRFGSLQWKPRDPTPKAVQPSFKIIEEYTLDDHESTGSSVTIKPVGVPTPVNVETVPVKTDALYLDITFK